MRFDTIKPKAHRREVAQTFRFRHARTAEYALQWRHNGRDTVPNHQPHDCVLNRLFRRRSKKTSKLRVTGLCARNSPGIGEFPAQILDDVIMECKHLMPRQNTRSFIVDDHISHIRIKFPKLSATCMGYKNYVGDLTTISLFKMTPHRGRLRSRWLFTRACVDA